MKKNSIVLWFIICSMCVFFAACGKTPVGGIDLEGVDIKDISSSNKLVEAADDNDEIEDNESLNTDAPAHDYFGGTEGLSIIAVGDNIYHDNIIQSGIKDDGTYNYEHIYSQIRDEISAADISIVNQETVFCPNGKTPIGYPEFLTPNEAADAMHKAGFDVFLCASNHTADNGIDAINHTIDLLSGIDGVSFSGIHKTKDETENITVIEKEGIKIAVLNYTELMNKALPEANTYMIDRISENKLKSDIAKANEIADIVIVCPHWGTEYSNSINSNQKKWVKIMSEAGADIVIGTHPHVIQPVEWVTSSTGHNMLVYYSLGNFVSRQIEGPRLLGGMAKLVITKNEDEAKISYASVTPLMMHYEQYPSINTAVYRLDKYTRELSALHGVSYYESLGKYSYDDTIALSEQIFGTSTEKQLEIPE